MSVGRNETIAQVIQDSLQSTASEEQVLSSIQSLGIEDVGTCIELELRSILLDQLSYLSKESLDALFSKIFRLMDISLFMATKGVTEPTIPYQLLEDLMDTVPTVDCWRILNYFESHLTEFCTSELLLKGKLILLRACIGLLRRYSRVMDSEACGRLILLLASALPPTERSGVNVKGNFHISNTTEYWKPEEHMTEEGALPMVDNNLFDWSFYDIFWRLQKFLANPTLAYDPNGWKECSACMSKVLQVMESDSVIDMEDSMEEEILPNTEEYVHETFVKYLTSPHLLKTQFRDSTFRRYHLVQYLIFLQHISAMRESVGGIDKSELEDMVNKIWQRLQRTYPRGNEFVAYIKKVLTHERVWLRWKTLENCKAFERVPIQRPTEEESLEKEEQRWHFLSSRWQRLYKKDREEDFNEEGNLLETDHACWSSKTKEHRQETLKDRERIYVPSVEELTQELQRDKEEGIEEDLQKKNSHLFRWKTLRVLLTNNWVKFNQIREENGNIEVLIPSEQKASSMS